MRSLNKTEKFFLYGMFGCSVEIIFTSMANQLEHFGDVTLQGKSYLWMLPIWGLGTLLLEKLYRKLIKHRVGWGYRGLIYAASCFAIEYAFGILIFVITDKIPWDYSYSSWHVSGAIRLDYTPFWFSLGLLGEQMFKYLEKIGVRDGQVLSDTRHFT